MTDASDTGDNLLQPMPTTRSSVSPTHTLETIHGPSLSHCIAYDNLDCLTHLRLGRLTCPGDAGPYSASHSRHTFQEASLLCTRWSSLSSTNFFTPRVPRTAHRADREPRTSDMSRAHGGARLTDHPAPEAPFATTCQDPVACLSPPTDTTTHIPGSTGHRQSCLHVCGSHGSAPQRFVNIVVAGRRRTIRLVSTLHLAVGPGRRHVRARSQSRSLTQALASTNRARCRVALGESETCR